MTSRQSANRHRASALGWGIALPLLVTLAPPALGQLQTPDPYDPYGGMYRGSSYPGYVNDPSLYNRPVFRPNAGANQMDAYYRSLNGGGDFGGSDRSFDAQFRANAAANGRDDLGSTTADERYKQNRQRREQLFFQHQRETDPAKKAQLLKEMNTLTAELGKDNAPKRRSGAPSIAGRGASRLDRGADAAPVLPASPYAMTLGLSIVRATPPPSQPERTTLPPLHRFGATPAGPAEADTAPAAAVDRSPNGVLERANRPAGARRPAPAIPGVSATRR